MLGELNKGNIWIIRISQCVTVVMVVIFSIVSLKGNTFYYKWLLNEHQNTTFLHRKYCLTYHPHHGRLGNQMFTYSSALGISAANNMHFVFPRATPSRPRPRNYLHRLTSVFKLENHTVTMNILKQCEKTGYVNMNDGDPEEPLHYLSKFMDIKNQSVRIFGHFNSFRYFNHISARVRKAFTFVDSLQQRAAKFHKTIDDAFMNKSNIAGFQLTKVGIHVRMGDFRKVKGLHLAPIDYYIKAAKLFLQNYTSVAFVVSTQPQEKEYVKELFKVFERTFPYATLYFAPLVSAGEDMAILAACDHMIMSIGAYGWWAGWLTGGTVIYYDDWTKEGSGYTKTNLSGIKVKLREERFPATWIPLS